MDGLLTPLLAGIEQAINLGNWKSQQQTMQWQQEAQNKTWEREDTAVQRRMADLKAAGLSPVLAASSSASTSAPIHLSTPELSSSGVNTAMQAMRMRQDIATSKAQQDLLDMQYANADAAGFVDRMTQEELRKDASTEGTLTYNLIHNRINSDIMQGLANQRDALDVIRNSDIARDLGIPSNKSGMSDIVTGALLTRRALTGEGLGSIPGAVIDAIPNILRSVPGAVLKYGKGIVQGIKGAIDEVR